MKSLIFTFVLVAAAISLPAQQLTNAPSADTNAIATSPTPSIQAPDEVMQKLSSLVHTQKYAEAQQLATGLLLAYPDDQRLLKAKALLDKLLASVKPSGAETTDTQSVNPVPRISQPAMVVPQPAQGVTPEHFTGMDKVEYNTLIELSREAQQSTDLDQQKASLNQFMKQSSVFLQGHPDELLLWELRAATALIMDDMLSGYEAGQRLLASGKADNDQDMQRLLTLLNIQGWLDKEKVAVAQKQKDNEARYAWLLGTWNVSTTAKGGTLVKGTKSTWGERFVATGLTIEGYQINTPEDVSMFEKIGESIKGQLSTAGIGGDLAKQVQAATAAASTAAAVATAATAATAATTTTDTRLILEGKKPDLRGTIHDSGEITWELASHDGWSPVLSCDADKGQGTMKMLFDPAGKGSSKNPAALMFTKGNVSVQPASAKKGT